MSAVQSALFTRPRHAAPAAAGLEIDVDNFAGGGGVAMGFEMATGKSFDIAINHDPAALEMHAANHPLTQHLCESVWKVDPIELCAGRPVRLAWFSPDCTHFSRAKGAKPVKRSIRGLAWIVIRWVKRLKPTNQHPRIVMLENVREFMDWGPLTPENMPCPHRKGLTFKKFVGTLRGLGYAVEWKVLNAADYGAPTHRRRLFLIARRDGQRIVWPEKTHGKQSLESNGTIPQSPSCDASRRCDRDEPFRLDGPETSSSWDQLGDGRTLSARQVADCRGHHHGESVHGGYGTGDGRRAGEVRETSLRSNGKADYPSLKSYRTAAECIDWSIPCPSIFERRKPLAEKTLRRIALGIKRYVLDNPRPFIVPLNHGGDHGRGRPMDMPGPTITGSRGEYVCVPNLIGIERSYKEWSGQNVDRPLGTITAMPKGGKHAMVAAMLKHYGGVVGHEMTRAVGAVTAKDHHSLLTANVVKFRGDSPGTSIEDPSPTITSGAGATRPAGAAHALGIAAATMIRMNHGQKQWNGADEPLPTTTSQGNKAGLVYAFLAKYFGTGIGQAVGSPAHTITSKDRFGVVTVQVDGEPYVIADIGLRMLTPRELARCQGFPDDYVLTGSKSNQVAKIGNSVPPQVVRALVSANLKDQS